MSICMWYKQPRLKLTDCTWTLSAHSVFKVIIIHNRRTCDPSARGACCVMRRWQRPTSVLGARFSLFYKLPFLYFLLAHLLLHVLTPLNSSLIVCFFHLSSEWTAQLVMSILVVSHTLSFSFPPSLSDVFSCSGAAVLKWVRYTDRDTSCIWINKGAQYWSYCACDRPLVKMFKRTFDILWSDLIHEWKKMKEFSFQVVVSCPLKSPWL